MKRSMTKQTTPNFYTLFNMVFQIPKNHYNLTLGAQFFKTAFIQSLTTNQPLSVMKNVFLPQLNIQPILRIYTN